MSMSRRTWHVQGAQPSTDAPRRRPDTASANASANASKRSSGGSRPPVGSDGRDSDGKRARRALHTSLLLLTTSRACKAGRCGPMMLLSRLSTRQLAVATLDRHPTPRRCKGPTCARCELDERPFRGAAADRALRAAPARWSRCPRLGPAHASAGYCAGAKSVSVRRPYRCTRSSRRSDNQAAARGVSATCGCRR